jgi:hypothetical protein
MEGNVVFNEKNFKVFKSEFDKSVQEKKEEFSFQGHRFVTGYAKYLIEYLEIEFNKTPKKPHHV